MRTTVIDYVTQQLAASGFAPIHSDLAMHLRPDIFGQGVNAFRDFGQQRHRAENLLQYFPSTRLYRAHVEGKGSVPVLSRHPQFLAERMAWILGMGISDVEEVPSYDPKPAPIGKLVARTSDPIALRFMNIVTAEPPRACKDCGGLSGAQTCMPAARGEIEGAGHDYAPDTSWPRRCLSYEPPRADRDEVLGRDPRTGVELWPEIADVTV